MQQLTMDSNLQTVGVRVEAEMSSVIVSIQTNAPLLKASCG